MTLYTTRREILAAFLGAPLAAIGCRAPKPSSRIAGEIVGASHDFGHLLRTSHEIGAAAGAPPALVADVVVVGAGIAGLTAAWQLQRQGIRDFLVIELEKSPGGTSVSSRSAVTAYPWGAHYLPVPLPHNGELITLLSEMKIIEDTTDAGVPVVGEQHLARDPDERLFLAGRWWEGIYPAAGASSEDQAQLHRFAREIDYWVAWRDEDGRAAFTIPATLCSADERVLSLDRISMLEWMNRQKLSSPRLRWFVEYACRDDYGSLLGDTSAWAGIFYYASRMAAPGSEEQPLLTWPEGNGRFVSHFMGAVGERFRPGLLATRIRSLSAGGGAEVLAIDRRSREPLRLACKKVILAVPQYLRPYILDSDAAAGDVAEPFRYGSWLVANLHVEREPEGNGWPMSWDNVLYDSPSLGYVNANHQEGTGHGPMVLTYYYPLCDSDPEKGRRRLLSVDWEGWSDIILTDLSRCHPGIRELVTRLDIMRWGHAMIRPYPGFISAPSRQAASVPQGAVHFAGCDLSGLALFEESFHHGIRAAEEVVTSLKNAR